MRGKKRAVGLLNVESRGQPAPLGDQPAFLDFRGQDEEPEKPRIPPTEYGGNEDEEDDSPKRRRQVIQEQEEKEQQPVMPRGEDVAIEESDEEKKIGEIVDSLLTSPSTTAHPMAATPLAKAMAISGGNQLDVGERMARSMRSTAEPAEASAAEKTLGRQRSRSPPEGSKREFACFMAKRYNQKKQDPSVTGELKYDKETDEMRQKINEARGKEGSNWVKYRATRTPEAEEVEKLMRSGMKAIPLKWIDIDKNAKLRTAGGPEVPLKLKSRMVLRGDLEPGDFRVDCPTATLVGTHLVISYAACGGYPLKSGDITAAFLQGKPIERVLLMRVPATGIPNVDGDGYALEPWSYLIAMTHIYGSRDAPRGFWMELRKEMLAEGLREVEPALYALSDQGKLLGLAVTHVDDILWTGSEAMDKVMNKIQERFTFGSTEQDDFRFCGRKIATKEGYIEISAPELLSKVKPIRIEGERSRSPTDDASMEEQSQMRAVLGSIGYVARLCRPELAYRCSALQGKQAKPRQIDLVATNKFLAAAQRTPENGIRFKKHLFNFDEAVLLSVTDASHAAEIHMSEKGRASGHKSQAGRFLLLASGMPKVGEPARVHILDWSSHTIKRVCRSTLQAEVLSSMDGCEQGNYVRMMLYNMYYPKDSIMEKKQLEIQAKDFKTLHWLSDCRSYIDSMSNVGQGVVSDKRLAIDLTALRQELWRMPGHEFGEPSIQDDIPEDCTDRLWWICTKDMIADALTKAMLWNDITSVCMNGLFSVREEPIRAVTSSQDQKT